MRASCTKLDIAITSVSIVAFGAIGGYFGYQLEGALGAVVGSVALEVIGIGCAGLICMHIKKQSLCGRKVEVSTPKFSRIRFDNYIYFHQETVIYKIEDKKR